MENGSVRLVNSAVYAMQMLQIQMAGEAAKAGITTDDDAVKLVKKMRT